MGWLEFKAWLRAMGRQQRQAEPDPERWTEASEENMRDLRERRDRLRGRG